MIECASLQHSMLSYPTFSMNTYRDAFESRYGSNRSYSKSPSLNFRSGHSTANGSVVANNNNDVILTSISSPVISRSTATAAKESPLHRPNNSFGLSKPPLPIQSSFVAKHAAYPVYDSHSMPSAMSRRRAPSMDRSPSMGGVSFAATGASSVPPSYQAPIILSSTPSSRVNSLSRRFEQALSSHHNPHNPVVTSSSTSLLARSSPTSMLAVNASTARRVLSTHEAAATGEGPVYVRNIELRPPAPPQISSIDAEYRKKSMSSATTTAEPLPPVSHKFSVNSGEQLEMGKTDLPESRLGAYYNKSRSLVDSNAIHGDRDIKGGLAGLRNLGNTCFMNSVVQCLSHTRLLREYCLHGGHRSDLNVNSKMKGLLMKTFYELIAEMWTSSSKSKHDEKLVINPEKFKVNVQKFAPRFTGYNQQDAQEFLRYLLEGLHEDVNKVRRSKTSSLQNSLSSACICEEESAKQAWKRYLTNDNSQVVDIFVGQLKSELKCCHCGHVSTTYDPFWDLSLQIPNNNEAGSSSSYSSRYSNSNSTSSSSVSLTDCMDAFTKEEILDGDEKPTCERCKTRRKCSKKFSIQKLPNVLVLHLKRFSGERYRSRLSTLVKFPLTKFDVSSYVCCSTPEHCRMPLYDLYAVSNHSGTPMMGHYTAYCRRSFDRCWFLFDDSRVTSVDEKEVVSSEAYLLFYELNAASVTCSTSQQQSVVMSRF